MKKINKSEQLIEYIKKHDKVFTRDLVAQFKVSVPTVHRVFEKLVKEGKYKRMHGGITLNLEKEEALFDKKLKNQEDQKRAICSYVAQNLLSVAEDEVIAIDSGTTAYHLVDYIELDNVTIISNCLKIASHSAQVLPHANVVCSGGSVRPQLSACVGADAINFFRHRRINTLILTCSGLEVDTRIIYEVDPLIAEVKQAMISVATKVILLVTSDKINNPSLTYLTDLSQTNHVVCDSGIEQKMIKKLSVKKNPQVHVVPLL